MGFSRCATCKYFSRSTENKAIGLCAKRDSEKMARKWKGLFGIRKEKTKIDNQSRPGLTTLPGTQTIISGIWKIN